MAYVNGATHNESSPLETAGVINCADNQPVPVPPERLQKIRKLLSEPFDPGEIKWRVPDGSTTGPDIPPDSGAHFPRGAPLVTAGGLVFVATAQDRMLRAYDRDDGKVLWSRQLPGGSEGIPSTYELGGRQYLALPVAAGAGLFAPMFEPAPPEPERLYMVFALPR